MKKPLLMGAMAFSILFAPFASADPDPLPSQIEAEIQGGNLDKAHVDLLQVLTDHPGSVKAQTMLKDVEAMQKAKQAAASQALAATMVSPVDPGNTGSMVYTLGKILLLVVPIGAIVFFFTRAARRRSASESSYATGPRSYRPAEPPMGPTQHGFTSSGTGQAPYPPGAQPMGAAQPSYAPGGQPMGGYAPPPAGGTTIINNEHSGSDLLTTIVAMEVLEDMTGRDRDTTTVVNETVINEGPQVNSGDNDTADTTTSTVDASDSDTWDSSGDTGTSDSWD